MRNLLILAILAVAACSAADQATVNSDLATAQKECVGASAIAALAPVGSNDKSNIVGTCAVIEAVPTQ